MDTSLSTMALSDVDLEHHWTGKVSFWRLSTECTSSSMTTASSSANVSGIRTITLILALCCASSSGSSQHWSRREHTSLSPGTKPTSGNDHHQSTRRHHHCQWLHHPHPLLLPLHRHHRPHPVKLVATAHHGWMASFHGRPAHAAAALSPPLPSCQQCLLQLLLSPSCYRDLHRVALLATTPAADTRWLLHTRLPSFLFVDTSRRLASRSSLYH